MQTSSILASFPPSGIREVFERASALERQGHDVIRLDVGRPDMETPAFIRDAAKQALDGGHTHYVSNLGVPELRTAISEKLLRDSGVAYDPATEVLVTVGGSEGVAVTMLAVLEPGAEAIVLEPAWPHYVAAIRLAGATPVTLRTEAGNAFRPTLDQVEAAITPRTRLLVINSPSNPTGAVYDEETVTGLIDLAVKHDLLILADEIYEYFVYDGPYRSAVEREQARDRTILLNGFSKAFGMTGWRLGYLAAPAPLIALLNKVHQHLTVCATSFAQWGAVAAYTHPETPDHLKRTQHAFMERRDAVLDALAPFDVVSGGLPAGAFYLFLPIPDGRGTSAEVALSLLQTAHVATVPGRVFGAPYDDYLRISYGSASPGVIREALSRIAEAFAAAGERNA